jgi:hypothetical protein
MKRKFKQWWSSISPISTKWIITSHLNWTQKWPHDIWHWKSRSLLGTDTNMCIFPVLPNQQTPLLDRINKILKKLYPIFIAWGSHWESHIYRISAFTIKYNVPRSTYENAYKIKIILPYTCRPVFICNVFERVVDKINCTSQSL